MLEFQDWYAFVLQIKIDTEAIISFCRVNMLLNIFVQHGVNVSL